MPDFLEYLPFDLISYIFSYIEQFECLEAMCVSRRWYENIPSHATPLWTKIDFSNPWTKNNPRLLRCLGPHVQNVIITYLQWNLVFKSFKEYNVIPKTLYICRDQYDDYENFENSVFLQLLNNTTTVQQQYLTKLTLADHPCDISLLDVARICPRQLTHLTIFLGSSDTLISNSTIIKKENEELNENSSRLCLLPHLLYLHLETRFQFSTRIEPLLRHCPQLRVFQCSRVNQVFWDPDNDEFHDLNFARIQQLCPKITSIDCDLTGLCEWTSIPSINNDKGLQNFRVAYDWSGDQTSTIFPALIQAQETLNELRIDQIPFDENFIEPDTAASVLISDNMNEDWSGLLELHLPRLRRLYARILTTNFARNMSLFLHNQSLTTCLEQILLEINPTFFTRKLVETFITMTHLKHLSLYLDWTTEQLFPYDTLGMPPTTTTVPINFDQFASLPSLSELSLRYVTLTDDMMQSLAKSPSLEMLVLCGPDDEEDEDYPPCTITSNELIRFATSVRYRLKKLELRDFPALNDDVLEAFGKIESLETLIMKYCYDVTDSGVRRFGDMIGRRFYQFVCSRCHPVSEVSIGYVQEKIKELRTL